MIVDRVLNPEIFPGNLLALKFPKSGPIQAYFLSDGMPTTYGSQTYAVVFNFSHNIEVESRKITLSLSFDLGDLTAPSIDEVTISRGDDAEFELFLQFILSDVVG